MEITEVRIKLSDEPSERLRAYCSITFDFCFVVRDLKIIDGSNGPFVAMPSRKLAAHCPSCRSKNHLRANHCNQCGYRLPTDRIVKDHEGRAKLYADIAHPINQQCRELIQEKVVAEFYLELERAKLPGYVSKYDDFDFDDEAPTISIQRQRPNPPHYTKPLPAEPEQQQRAQAMNPPVPRIAPTPPENNNSSSNTAPVSQPTPPLINAPHQRPNGKSNPTPIHRPGEKPEFGAGLF